MDPAAIRYRFPATSPASEADTTITALEQRVAGPTASPFDLTDLADQYFRRGQRTGNPADHAASEALATRSLAILPAPNAAALTLAKLANARHDFRKAIE
ncbi:MAG: hypothetical protein H0X17_12785, partial [Deltaproteobacteria bacterium]|nr:hypothetical protein [Deltaproteobacteria bacterium]